jgi:hypothetical protein
MPIRLPDVQDGVTTHGCGLEIDELRAAFFAQGAERAIRYGTTFEQVLWHVRESEAAGLQSRPPRVRYFEDLIHALACSSGVDFAWRDLHDQHERALIRMCRERMGPDDALVFVRRLFARLRRGRRDMATGRMLSLRSYDGSCSLRHWLRDRVLDAFDEEPARGRVRTRIPADHVPEAARSRVRAGSKGSARLRYPGVRVEWPLQGPELEHPTRESG